MDLVGGATQWRLAADRGWDSVEAWKLCSCVVPWRSCPCVEPGGRGVVQRRRWIWSEARHSGGLAADRLHTRCADVPVVSGSAVPATGGRLT